MIIGTSYFKNRRAAIRYYKDYHLTAEDVDRKLDEGEIHLGIPPGDKRCFLIDNGTRWAIED